VATMPPFATGLHRVTAATYAYMQPDGSWGLNNAMLVVNRGESLLVDTLCDPAHQRLMHRNIAETVPEAKKIDKVFLTHWHCDHVFGVSVDELKDSTVIASQLCADYMATQPPTAWVAAQETLTGDAALQHKKWIGTRFDFSDVKYRAVDQTFEGKTEFHIGDLRIVVVEAKPCHTKSDSMVWVPDEGVCHTGDLGMGGRHLSLQYPFIRHMVEAYETMISWGCEVYVTGHGPSMTLAQMKTFVEYLHFLQGKIKNYYVAGMSLDEATDDLLRNLGPYKTWGNPSGLYFTIKMGLCELAGDTEIFWRRNNPDFIGTVWRVGKELPKRHPELFAQF
jgi:cyclase